MEETTILKHHEIAAKLRRLAWQICEHHYKEEVIFLAGIAGNGYTMAEKLRDILREINGPATEMVKISLDKQDPLSSGVKADKDPENWKDKVVIVVDDVLNSGKTLIYAANYFLSFPVKRIRTVVLVDRSHRNFPVKADFVGMSLATTLQENIVVEFGAEDKAYLE